MSNHSYGTKSPQESSRRAVQAEIGALRKTVKNAPGRAQVLLVIDREMLSLQGRGCGMRFV